MIEQLTALPKAIREKELYLYDAVVQLKEKELIKASIENRIEREVAQETEGGKPKYSNISKRKIEQSNRLSQDSVYKLTLKEIQAIKETKDKEEIQFSFLKRTLRSLEAISRL